MREFFAKRASQQQISDILRDYARLAMLQDNDTPALFDTEVTPRERLWDIATKKGERWSVTSEAAPSTEEIAEAKRQYDDVVAKYTNPDGTKKAGWMKAPNGKPTKLIEALGKEAGERAWVQINTPNFRANYFGFYNLPEHQFNIVETEKATFNSVDDGIEWAKSNGIVGLMTNDETNGKGEINISVGSVSEMLNLAQVNKSINKDAHFAALTQIKNIIRESELADRHPHYAKATDGKRDKANGVIKGVNIDVLYGAMRFNGETYRVKTTLRRYVDTNRTTKAYAYEVSEIEVLAGKPESPQSFGTSNTSITGNILLQGVRNHKGNLILEDFSKVVDENGEPMVVYHGSNLAKGLSPYLVLNCKTRKLAH